MRLHQIRYNVDIRPYDWVWNVIAALMIVAGLVLIFRTRHARTYKEGAES